MKFVADEMLGRLAKWLRILGFDTAYSSKISDYELIRIAYQEGRVILTRDKKFLEKTAYPSVVVIENERYKKQCAELIEKLKLPIHEERVFSFCLSCNVPVLVVADREKVRSLIPPYIYERHRSFHQCPHCGKVYWGGSHYENTLEKVRRFHSS